MTTHREPHEPAFPIRRSHDDNPNPWLSSLWVVTAVAALAGIITTATNADPGAFDHNPTAAAVGHVLLGVAGVLLAGLLVAGAICWQLKQR